MGVLGELWIKLGLKNENLNKGIKDSQNKVGGFAQNVLKIGKAIGSAFAVKKIIDFAKETADLANKANGVKKAFDKIADPKLLKDLRNATQGTVDDLQLMQRAVQANNFNIPLSELSTYLQFASQRARETGQSVDYLVDSIVTGLGRQSVLILDNLGISAKEIRDNMKDGSTMAKAVGKIIKEQMGNAATDIDNAATATERLATAWTNFKISVGSKTSGAAGWVKSQITDMLDYFNTVLNSKTLTDLEKVRMLTVGSSKARQKLLAEQKVNEEAQKLADERLSKIKTIKDALKELEIVNVEVQRNSTRSAGDLFRLTSEYTKQGLEAFIAAKKQEQKVNAEELKKKNSLITSLEEEIKRKTEIRDLSANTDEVARLNAEIQKMEERVKILKMTNKELKKYRKSQTEQLETIPTIFTLGKKANSDKDNIIKTTAQGFFDIDILKDNLRQGKDILDQAQREWMQSGKNLHEFTVNQQKKIADAAAMITNSLVSGISSSLNELANVLAGVEGANVGSVVIALLSPLADACISAGLLIMTTGEGIDALRNSLTTFLGVGAVAAGAALMAVGLAAKTGLAAIGKGSKSSGAGAVNSAVNSYTGGYGVTNSHFNQGEQLALSTTLKGQDLLLAIERTQNNRRR